MHRLLLNARAKLAVAAHSGAPPSSRSCDPSSPHLLPSPSPKCVPGQDVIQTGVSAADRTMKAQLVGELRTLLTHKASGVAGRGAWAGAWEASSEKIRWSTGSRLARLTPPLLASLQAGPNGMRIADVLDAINAQSSVRVSERDLRLALTELVRGR